MAVYCISYTPSQLPEVKHALSVSSGRTMTSFVVECPRIGHGQGHAGTTKLETNAQKCGKENKSHSREGPLYYPQQPVKSLTIKFNPSSRELSLHFSIEEVWSCSLQGCIGERWKFVPRRFPPFTLPFPHSLNQHTGLPLAVASPSIWLE